MAEWEGGTVFPERYGDFGFKTEILLSLMDSGGVDKAVLLQAPNYGFQNGYIAESVKKHPERLAGACAFDPYAKKALELFRHFTDDLGYRAVKFEISESWGLSGIHPDLSLDAPVFDPIWEWVLQRDVTVVVDTGPRGNINWRTDTIARTFRRYPGMRFVLAHVLFPHDNGFNEERLRMIEEIAGENCYFDISNIIHDHEEYPYPNLQKYLRSLVDLAGADHVMWGSDLPWILCQYGYPELSRYLIDGGVFSKQELSWILGETAEKVYFRNKNTEIT